ncbi:MAG: hypothetical protein IPJ71_02490 [Bdellovibrionales bacterium]|nr:hypothetical protein [Bdellovibrionales bacterium]
MKKFIFTLIIFFCFFGEIRMKASSKTLNSKEKDVHFVDRNKETHHFQIGEGLVSDPFDCLEKKQYPCSIKTESERSWAWKWEDGRVEFSKKTMAILESPGEVRLIEGSLVVYSESGSAWLRTLFGDVALSEGVAMVRRDHSIGKFEVNALIGEVLIYPRGSKEVLSLPQGYRNWLGEMQSGGSSASEIPQSINKKVVLEMWPLVFSGEPSEYFQKVRNFHSSWMEAVKNIGSFHQTLVERRLAFIEEERRLAQARRAQAETEKRMLRDLFRRKNFLD